MLKNLIFMATIVGIFAGELSAANNQPAGKNNNLAGKAVYIERETICTNGDCETNTTAINVSKPKCPEGQYSFRARCLTHEAAYGMSGMNCELPGSDITAGVAGNLVVVESRKTIECVRTW